MPPPSDRDTFLALLDSSFSRGWHGPALLGSLRGITAPRAAKTPKGLKHSIWHIVLHAAYWKYAVCLRLAAAGVVIPGIELDSKGHPRGTFPRSPSNWPRLPAPASEKAWRTDVVFLRRWHETLVRAARDLDPARLDVIPPGGKKATPRILLTGIAAHDVYHAGQVQLLKRLV